MAFSETSSGSSARGSGGTQSYSKRRFKRSKKQYRKRRKPSRNALFRKNIKNALTPIAESTNTKNPIEQIMKMGGRPDVSFVDHKFQQTYDYSDIKPLCTDENFQVTEKLGYYKIQSNGKIPKLKLICSRKIAKLIDNINPKYIDQNQWFNFWRIIWNLILKYQLDSIRIFSIFINRFYEKDSFKCHSINLNKSDQLQRHIGKSVDNRNLILKSYLIHSKHRMEILFKNINYSKFLMQLNSFRFNNLTILNLKNLDLSNVIDNSNFLLELTQLKNLCYLNCYGLKSVDDTIIKSWLIAINSNKWKNLSCLILTNTSAATIFDSNLLNSPKRLGNLQYIETNSFISEKTLSLKNWLSLSNSLFVSNLQDAEKMKYLVDNKYIETPIDLMNNYILDFKISNKIFEDLTSEDADDSNNPKTENSFDATSTRLNDNVNENWRLRIDNSNLRSNLNCIYFNKDNLNKPKPERQTKQQISRSSSIKKKSFIKVTNINQFFNDSRNKR
ncbi:hypothetical protein B5S28_g954 [[Candida] boidinii]|nr:hypothetical protein B5S28_g954 [[Candida] boidinii]OWB77564.1 hypothetical protein B5S32_g1734 [[Candida] boidinii]